jgi:hypothetical protein
VECLGLRTAVPCGRGDRAPPRKPPWASSPGLPSKAISPRMALPRRGGLRTPARECRGFTHASCPLGCPVIVHAGGGNAMPCRSSRWITRAHRVRPSEKKASRVVSGYSPLSYRFALALPRRGGLRTPARKALASPRHVSARPPGVRLCIRWECNASACVRPCPKAASLHPFYPTGIPIRLIFSNLGWSLGWTPSP